MILVACGTGRADAPPEGSAAVPRQSVDPTGPAAPAKGEACLGVGDRGIWSDLDDELQIALPAGLTVIG